MLSGIVLMLAIGTLVQRGDVVANFLSGDPDPIQLKRDEVSVDADTLTRIDVLANDEGLRDRDVDKLVVLTQPQCGRVFVQDGALQYLGERHCEASQRIVYGLRENADNLEGEVLVTVKGATGRAREAEKVVARREPSRPVTEPGAPRPADGSLALGGAAAGSSDAPTRPGLATADAPSAAAVPGVRAPSSPDAPGGERMPRIATETPSIGASGAPVQAGGSPSLALRAPSSPAGLAVPGGGISGNEPAGAEVAPASGGAPMLAGLAEPSAPVVRDAGMTPPSIGGESSVSGIGSSDSSLSRAAPGALGQGVATIALARVEVPDSVAAPASVKSQELSLNVDGASEAAAPSSARIAPEIHQDDGQHVAMLEPSAGLGEILTFGDPLTLRPIDTALPAVLDAPMEEGGSTEIEQAALQPAAGVVTGGDGATVQPEALPQPEKVAALPRVDLNCAVPPSITLDIRPAGETELVITSPCHADSIAQLSYEGIDLGIRIDRSGQGALTVLGFQSSSEAVLAFSDGETLPFSLPFTGTDRVERVALAWDAPVALELHALEFGAAFDSEGHVSPYQPGDFREVRRRGGGYLTTYEPVEGVGQSVQIYSHWLRRGGKTGVVKLYIDFASRHRERLAGTCGEGALARPSFTVVRSSRGRLETPISRRLASVDCSVVETMQSHLIEAAVRDIIISQR